MQSKLQREGQRKEAKQWGWVLKSVCDYSPYVYIQENTLISSACIWQIGLYMYATYSVQILCMRVLACGGQGGILAQCTPCQGGPASRSWYRMLPLCLLHSSA